MDKFILKAITKLQKDLNITIPITNTKFATHEITNPYMLILLSEENIFPITIFLPKEEILQIRNDKTLKQAIKRLRNLIDFNKL